MPPGDLLDIAYDAERFRREGHKLIDFLADSLNKATRGELDQVFPWNEPEATSQEIEQLVASPSELFEATWNRSIRLHDPRYVGHQISPPLPITALSGLFSDLINNGMGVYEMGMAGTAMERFVVKTVAKQMGFDDSADGVMTSGGSLGNLTALLAARSKMANSDVWNVGSQEPLSVMVSDQAHYCVDRAVRIMGWGADGVISVPTDDGFHMKTEMLKSSYEEAKSKGRNVIAVIGSACCTSTGSFDNLVQIGHFCNEHGLWFHVDGAHGGAAAFSQKYRHLVDGIHLADSVVMDFHKLLMVPAISTVLFFRNGLDGYQAFTQKAQYLWNEETPEWFNLAKRTFECTKTMMSLKVFSIIANYGIDIFDANVTRLHDTAAAFAELIKLNPDFELAVEPETNIVCFRFVGSEYNRIGDANRCDFNRKIRDELVTAGKFYIVQTTLHDELWLRTTIANPFTTTQHLQTLLDELTRIAKRLVPCQS